MSLPAPYEQLVGLSRSMAELAQKGDWDLLAEHGQARLALIASIGEYPPAGLSQAQSREIRTALEQVREFDLQVLAQVEPWRDQVAQWLFPAQR